MNKLLVLLFLMFSCNIIIAQTNTEKKIKQFEDKLVSFSDSQKVYIQKLENLKLQWIREGIKQYGLPKITGEGMLINHSAMSMFYDERHGQSQWVVHMILPDIKTGIQ